MSQSQVKDVTISLNTIEQLFVAPVVNPFAENEVELLGEAALLLEDIQPSATEAGHSLDFGAS